LFELLHGARRKVPTAAVGGESRPPRGRPAPIASSSPLVRDLQRQIERAAKLNSTILLTGESGTGKTFYAREIHSLSPRADQDFVTVSCPALPPQLLESELFGHERGAFTGATSARAGRFEQATRGTLFLDEIGDLPPELQPKLLNVLQDREFFRVGGNKMLRSEARLIAATNVDLQERVAQGRFREDLYYRLNIIELCIPPLRERKEDLAALAEHILARIASSRGVAGWSLSDAAIKAMEAYDWPGNVRQLENVLERCTAFADETILEPNDVVHLLEPRRDKPCEDDSPKTLHETERMALEAAYKRNRGNKARTARELGVSERSIYNLIARYGIQ
jgi:DNA-binding NtrC family response regulator